MVSELLISFSLVSITVSLHAIGTTALLRTLLVSHGWKNPGYVNFISLLISLTCWLLFCHMVEIAVWALFYWWQGCLPDAESAFYFSGITYTTVGYGDLILPPSWRMLAPIEALTGILMCGLSTGLFLAVLQRRFSILMQMKIS